MQWKVAEVSKILYLQKYFSWKPFQQRTTLICFFKDSEIKTGIILDGIKITV